MPDPNAVLKGATVSFHTNDDDKDPDTNVTVTVRQADGTIDAHISDPFGHFPDQSDSGPFNLELFNPGTRGELQGGNVTLRIDPAGNDTWRFNALVDLLFSDGSHLNTAADGLELTDEHQQQAFGLA
jgi:hypothetical protein